MAADTSPIYSTIVLFKYYAYAAQNGPFASHVKSTEKQVQTIHTDTDIENQPVAQVPAASHDAIGGGITNSAPGVSTQPHSRKLEGFSDTN
jgi:hypothetical protein